jgi:hypothetical protein
MDDYVLATVRVRNVRCSIPCSTALLLLLLHLCMPAEAKFEHNNLIGTIPEAFGTMSRGVRRFQVDHNHMTGTIPMSFRCVLSKQCLCVVL